LGFSDSIVETLELNYHVHPRGMDTTSNTHRPDSATTTERLAYRRGYRRLSRLP
jgi:hypothetical protein